MDEKTKTLLNAIEARWRRTTPGPIDVHRIDQHDGTIAYQLQQADGAPKAENDDNEIASRVLTQFDDLDNPDARYDAEACAKAYEDVPALIALVREQEKRIAEFEAATRMLVKECDVHVVSLGFGRFSVTQYVLNAMRKLHALVEGKNDG